VEVPTAGRRVGYVVSRFPKLSETFILREMDELEAQGWNVELYPLLTESAAVVHPAALPWLDRARRLPMLSVAVLSANARALRKAPAAYALLWLKVLYGYRRAPTSLVRALAFVPSSVHLAERVRRDRLPRLHAHYATYPLLACWVVHRLVGTPYSVTVHAHDIFLGTPMLATKLRTADAVVAISEFNKRFLVEHVDAALAQRTLVVRCGVVAEQYSSGHVEPADDGVLDVLCVGSLQEYKGQIHLIEACRLLVARGRRVRCLLVGQGPDEQMLRRRIEQLDLAGAVTLAGPRTEEQVAALMKKADAYVQPSVVAADGQMEGIPVALMEALASRLPVVATDLSGVPELVRDGETGWLVPPGDPGAIAEALEQIADSPAVASGRARAGYELVAAEFNLTVNVRRLATLLDELDALRVGSAT